VRGLGLGIGYWGIGGCGEGALFVVRPRRRACTGFKGFVLRAYRQIGVHLMQNLLLQN
jgi:hypothetical protein